MKNNPTLIYCGGVLAVDKRYFWQGNLIVAYQLVNGQRATVKATQVFWRYFNYTDKEMLAIVGDNFQDTLNTEIKNVIKLEISKEQ